jgi:hypothetical protein
VVIIPPITTTTAIIIPIITPVDIDPEDLLPPLIYDDIFVLSVISG